MKKKILSLLMIFILIIVSFNVSIAESSKQLKVTFLDVGQADCIIVQSPNGKNMIIDAGNNEDSSTVVDYIKKLKIQKFDYVIGTHPDEDHIGSLDNVINDFSIGKIYMPKITKTTKTFEDVVDVIKKKELKVTAPVAGSTFKLGETTCTILAPNSSNYDETNNYSIVLKLTYKKNSFLFTGDAEDISEKEMLSKGYDLKADVIKVGHHGSSSSSTEKFIKAVSPKYAIISVGKDNDYGHPAKSTIDRLSVAKIQMFRTDVNGTITATADGKTIKFDKTSTPDKSQAPPNGKITKTDRSNSGDVTVYITKSGTKYHKDGCSSLSKSKITIKLKDAKANGYTSCNKCNPPK